MKVRNVTRNCVLGDLVEVADTSAKRRTGLLKHESLGDGEGLWIVPCEAVHMVGMKFAIDVIYLSRERKVVKTRSRLEPGWTFSMCLTAHSVLELPAGVLDRTGTAKGDQLELIR